MTPLEFNRMVSDARANILWDKGEYLCERKVYNGYTVKIYSLDNFFVEAYFRCSDNSILDITALDTEDDWAGFLNSVNIKVLLKT